MIDPNKYAGAGDNAGWLAMMDAFREVDQKWDAIEAAGREGDALAAAEAARRARDAQLAAEHKKGVQEGRDSQIPYVRAGAAAAMGHELEARAWQSMALSLAASAKARDLTKTPTPKALSAESLQAVHSVERWRTLASLIVAKSDGGAIPLDPDNAGGVSFFGVKWVRPDGTGAEPTTDVVGDIERRRPGMMKYLSSSGWDALRELVESGMVPSDMPDRVTARAKQVRGDFEAELAALRARPAALRAEIAELEVALPTAAAEVDRLSVRNVKPLLRGKDEWAQKERVREAALAAAAARKQEIESRLAAAKEDLVKADKAGAERIARIERDLSLDVPEVTAIARAVNVPIPDIVLGMGE